MADNSRLQMVGPCSKTLLFGVLPSVPYSVFPPVPSNVAGSDRSYGLSSRATEIFSALGPTQGWKLPVTLWVKVVELVVSRTQTAYQELNCLFRDRQ